MKITLRPAIIGIFFSAASISSMAHSSTTFSIQSLTPDFSDLIDSHATPEVITRHAKWAEGPVCQADGLFVFSDVKANKVLSWSPQQGIKTWLSPSDFQNGHTIDAQGRIIAASHGKRAILRQDKDGQWTVLADRWQGKRLNSPNDVTVSPDGSIWFTDPTFGVLSKSEGYGGKVEQDGEYVYRYQPDENTLERMKTPGVHSPNGLAFSPDGRTLYISDTQLAHNFEDKSLRHQIMAYTVQGKTLNHGKLFAIVNPGIPDGIRTDRQGNVWSSSKEGIHVFSPQGRLLGKIFVPSQDTGNLAFCTDPNRQRWVYITAANLVLRVPVLTEGATASSAAPKP
ncbi:SMP-30/gluconolactonase/LRE family protein [Rosenbergiella epipactidis]|uniref:SMP-30/gluconolactonase/LRE family protein n=1 Tax=Rosenbergiella epipactidis TaxID=1544694 RepID=UPI001F4EEB01|nr:SMP-30/gluconolactonase/LRE family protein [Rosenbergiella epipactidis]